MTRIYHNVIETNDLKRLLQEMITRDAKIETDRSGAVDKAA